MKKEKKKAVLGLILMVLTMISMSIPVFATDKVTTTVYDSASTTESLSWKAFDALLGYNDMGTAQTGSPTTGIYEFRVGGTADGELNYAWTFDGSAFTTPYTTATKGPISLTVKTANDPEKGLGITFDLYTAHTDGTDNSLSGDATLKLKVSDFFADGTKLDITGPDAYSKEVSVADGYISFDVKKGGTYVAKADPDAASANTATNEIATAESPKSVNIGMVILIIVLVLVVFGGIVVFLKRKGKHDN